MQLPTHTMQNTQTPSRELVVEAACSGLLAMQHYSQFEAVDQVHLEWDAEQFAQQH